MFYDLALTRERLEKYLLASDRYINSYKYFSELLSNNNSKANILRSKTLFLKLAAEFELTVRWFIIL